MTLERNTVATDSNSVDGLTRSFHMLATGLTLALLILVAGCNGSDSDGSDATAAASLTPPGDAGDEQDPTKLQPVRPAEFVSTDAVVMMAPDSLFSSAVSWTHFRLALASRGSGTGQTQETKACGEGRLVVVNDELRDLASPYSGALFNTETTDAQNCIDGAEADGVSVTRIVTNGQRVFGYPAEGIGSNGDPDTFIGYEKFGVSLNEPFTDKLTEERSGAEEVSYSKWSRLWDGHVMIRHLPDPDAPLGSAGGAALMSDISLAVDGAEGAQSIQRSQLGDPRTPDNRMQFSFSPLDDPNPYDSRQEEYSGLYGMEIVAVDGEPVPPSCTLGRFQVTTIQPLMIERLPDDEAFIGGAADEPQSGVLLMEDDVGNKATVTYDGVGNTITVALNDGPSQTYTYEQVNQLFETNCGPID